MSCTYLLNKLTFFYHDYYSCEIVLIIVKHDEAENRIILEGNKLQYIVYTKHNKMITKPILNTIFPNTPP